jgi:ribose transport system substrate-binding protein
MVAATQDLLNQGISALIISPIKPDAMGPIVDAAKKKGIPVVVNDIGGGGTNYDVIVISDNSKGGVLAADEMDKLIKGKAGASKKVASITCEPSAVYAARRNQGFEARIKELGYTVVASLSAQQAGRGLQGLDVCPPIPTWRVCSLQRPDGREAVRPLPTRAERRQTFSSSANRRNCPQAIKAGMAATVASACKMGKMTVDLATN